MKVLVSGATGLVGKALLEQLAGNGHTVNYLTTSNSKLDLFPNATGFLWDPMEFEMDVEALNGVETIINLAGSTIAKRWTTSQKELILKSRIRSLQTLYQNLDDGEHSVRQLVSASAIGIYPSSKTEYYDEESKLRGNDFLAQTVVAWENGMDKFEKLGIDVTKLRIGLVLSNKGGTLASMLPSVKWHIGSILGKGDQWMSFIHIDDLVSIFLWVLERQLSGAYNAVAPNAVMHSKFMRSLAKYNNSKIWLPKVPSFILKMMLGEMSSLLLSSQRVSAKKIGESGFEFLYPTLESSFAQLFDN